MHSNSSREAAFFMSLLKEDCIKCRPETRIFSLMSAAGAGSIQNLGRLSAPKTVARKARRIGFHCLTCWF
jgi:hypothetical protein